MKATVNDMMPPRRLDSAPRSSLPARLFSTLLITCILLVSSASVKAFGNGSHLNTTERFTAETQSSRRLRRDLNSISPRPLCVLCVSAVSSSAPPLMQRKGSASRNAAAAPAAQASAKSITVATEPNALVWLDDVRRGTTDASGQLVIAKVSAGRHALRVRAAGFQERTLPLLPAQRGRIAVKLIPTTDEAELAFQQAEALAEKGGSDARKQAVELYRRALTLRPRFPAAHVGLARALLAQTNYDDALKEIEEARRDRPAYPEASAVEGRINRAAAFNDAAVESYRRAIREGRGVQPEAWTGLGIVLEEEANHAEAAEAFRKAIAQLSDTEPALYQLLGNVYERLEKYREAVAAYEKYLELAPEGNFASAISSIIDQLRQQAADQQSQPN